MRCVNPRSIYVPFRRGQDAGDQIVGEDALRAFTLAVDRERDALVQECEVGCRLALQQFLWVDIAEPIAKRGIVLARDAGAVEHLVVAVAKGVTLKLNQAL